MVSNILVGKQIELVNYDDINWDEKWPYQMCIYCVVYHCPAYTSYVYWEEYMDIIQISCYSCPAECCTPVVDYAKKSLRLQYKPINLLTIGRSWRNLKKKAYNCLQWTVTKLVLKSTSSISKNIYPICHSLHKRISNP
jgi:hypothetical protein